MWEETWGKLKGIWKESEIWEESVSIGFKTRFPKSEEDLSRCAAMFTNSSYFDSSLDQNTIIRLIKALCTEGIGQILITECKPITPFLGEHPFISVSFCVYITREYAEALVAMSEVRFICMDFLKRYRAFMDDGGDNPVHTRASIEERYHEPNFRMYFLSLFHIFHPKLTFVSKIPQSVQQRFSNDRQAFTLRIFGGFRYSGWFNCICGDAFLEGYTKLLHNVLRPDKDNGIVAPDKRHYLLCTTRDAQASKEIGLQGYYDTVGWFASNLFNERKPFAKLSKGLERRAAYLIALQYEPNRIMRFLYPDEVSHDMKDIPEVIQGRYRSLRFKICEKFKNCGHMDAEAECNEMNLHIAICRNMHEVRPLIFPLYPDPSIRSYSKQKSSK